MKTKRLTNTTALKVKYIANSGTLNITQLNCNKRIRTSKHRGLEILDFIASRLDDSDLILSYSNVVDNSQNDYYLINIDFTGNSFENILDIFK